MTSAKYPYALKPTAKRGKQPIAWRFWPVSPDDVPDELYADVVAFNLHRQIAAIGYGDFPLHETSNDREEFAADEGWSTGSRDIAFQFTWQMRRGDIVFICRDTTFVIAWGLLLDDLPLFFEGDDPIWTELGPLRQRVYDEGEGENFCNYRRVDHWRRVDAQPKIQGGKLPSSPQPTVLPYQEADVVRWLGIKENLAETRRNLPEAVTDPKHFTLSPAKRRHSTGKGGQGRILDKHRRQAVEWHAMELAQRYYERRGFTVEDTSSREPFDLRCTKGKAIRLVEVKGSTLTGSTVELTAGEVESAREYVTDLFVVSDIECIGHGDDARATGGKCRVFRDWAPDDDDLESTAYRYTVPSGGRAVRVAEGEEE